MNRHQQMGAVRGPVRSGGGRGRAWGLWVVLALTALVGCDDDDKAGGGGAADAAWGGGGQGGAGGGAGGNQSAPDAGFGFGGEGGAGGSGNEGGGWHGGGNEAGGAGGGGAGGFGGEGGAGGAGGDGGGFASDAGAPPPNPNPVDPENPDAPFFDEGGNTNINLGGSQDLGYFRRLLNDGVVPRSEDFDAGGFFAEHHTPLPRPDCGERVCLQAMLGAMGNLIDGSNCTLLQVGLNSPLVANPARRPPLHLVVSIDVSGSMDASGKMDFVRQGMQQLIDALRDEDQLGIVTYDARARVLAPIGPVAGNRAVLRALVGGLRAEGGTNLYDGLEIAYLESLRAYDSGVQNRVIVLSDGQPTNGITSERAILDMSAAYNSEGVGLTSIGLGSGFNLSLMRGLAEGGDGNFYFVEDAAAVVEVFGQEVSFFTVPVAFDVEVSVRMGADYGFVRAYGSRWWADAPAGNGGGLTVPSVFLAHRQSHDDVGPGGTRRGGGSALLLELMPTVEGRPVQIPDVAEVHLRYREPGTDRIVEQSARVGRENLPLALVPARGEAFFENDIVEKSFVMLNVFTAMQLAVDRFHLERDHQGAMDLVDQMIAVLISYNRTANEGLGDVDLELDAELLTQLLDVMEANARNARRPAPEDRDEEAWPLD